MATFRRFLLRLVNFFQPHRAESELERELAAHLGVLEDEYDEVGQSLKMQQSGVGNRSLPQAKCREIPEALQVRKPGVAT